MAIKVAFVTGAASGIGRATAAEFLAAGYAVLLVDRDEAGGQAAAAELAGQGECHFHACDVTDEASVEAAVAAATARWGRIDAAFNGAGIEGGPGGIVDSSIDKFDSIFAVNVRGVFMCQRAQMRVMIAQGSGAIVNCASAAGLVGVPGLAAYAASKHAVVGMTRSGALEVSRRGVRINAVCPGMIDTPMWQRSVSPEATAQLLARDPAGRLGQAGEIAAAVVWLCSPAASFVNGHAMAIDGGMTAG